MPEFSRRDRGKLRKPLIRIADNPVPRVTDALEHCDAEF